jgi:hypothetical protein
VLLLTGSLVDHIIAWMHLSRWQKLVVSDVSDFISLLGVDHECGYRDESFVGLLVKSELYVDLTAGQ